jgi:cell division protein FtsZ
MSDGPMHRLGADGGQPKRPTMTIVGCGGAGCNTLARASDRGLELGRHVATNTDAAHLLSTRAHRKVLLGRQTTLGLGANMDMALGEKACREARDSLDEVMAEADIVVVLSGLGGGTGSGAAPVVAEMARRRGSLAISLSTLPFSVEGNNRRNNAEVGRASLSIASDISVVLPNDHLLEAFPNLSLLEAFRAADETLLEPVDLLRKLLTSADLPMLHRAFRGVGASHLGRGESNRRRGYSKALDDALAAMFPPIHVRACDRALVMFQAGHDDPPDGELEEMARSLHLAMAGGAQTLWGVTRDRAMAEGLRVVAVIASGPKR